MDNVLRKTIREEIRAALDERNETSQANSDTSAKKPKTEQRLSNLLCKIRSASTSSKKESNPKPKRVQVKYQRYDHEFMTFTNVKSKEGGGIRFIEVQSDKPVTFKDIKMKAVGLYFDKDDNNFFMENRYKCVFDFVTMPEEELGDEDLWKYLKERDVLVSLCFSFTVNLL